jgi:hypothetical protein
MTPHDAPVHCWHFSSTHGLANLNRASGRSLVRDDADSMKSLSTSRGGFKYPIRPSGPDRPISRWPTLQVLLGHVLPADPSPLMASSGSVYKIKYKAEYYVDRKHVPGGFVAFDGFHLQAFIGPEVYNR